MKWRRSDEDLHHNDPGVAITTPPMADATDLTQLVERHKIAATIEHGIHRMNPAFDPDDTDTDVETLGAFAFNPNQP